MATIWVHGNAGFSNEDPNWIIQRTTSGANIVAKAVGTGTFYVPFQINYTVSPSTPFSFWLDATTPNDKRVLVNAVAVLIGDKYVGGQNFGASGVPWTGPGKGSATITVPAGGVLVIGVTFTATAKGATFRLLAVGI